MMIFSATPSFRGGANGSGPCGRPDDRLRTEPGIQRCGVDGEAGWIPGSRKRAPRNDDT
jgi:hypothetical protein